MKIICLLVLVAVIAGDPIKSFNPVWQLAMNINPADGNIMGYTNNGWDQGTAIGSDENALSMDYLSHWVWREPADYIAIVRHQHREVEAVKVFKFTNWGISLLDRFQDMNPGS